MDDLCHFQFTRFEKKHLQEKEITIPSIELIEFYGSNNSKFSMVKSYFPKLKIVARGNTIKVNGEEHEVENFEEKISLLVWFLQKFNRLSITDIEHIMVSTEAEVKNSSSFKDNVIVHGPHGNTIKARTKNQAKMVSESGKNDMLFAIGPAGTGKTYTAVALAVRALKEKKVKRIILTRPAVEAGENLGFLPGDLKEKLDPYMQPLYDGLIDMLHYEKLAEYLEKGVIEIAPLAFMRGRTLDKAFVILDEAQNTTIPQMKMFLTRMGEKAQFIVTGDTTQVDLPRHQQSGLKKAVDLLDGVKGISVIRLDASDVIRHPLVKKVIKAFGDDAIKQEKLDEKRKEERRKERNKD